MTVKLINMKLRRMSSKTWKVGYTHTCPCHAFWIPRSEIKETDLEHEGQVGFVVINPDRVVDNRARRVHGLGDLPQK